MDLLIAAQPKGLWEGILFAIESWVGNYAIAIILITLIIKVVMLPFDFMNKIVTKKNSRKQMAMKPELDKIKARYGNNQELVQKKTMELYKSKNYSVGGMCGAMLGYMVVSMLIFFSLFGSLNTISNYKIYSEYETVRTAYVTKYDEIIEDGTLPSEYTSIEEYATIEAQNSAKEKYGEVRTSFLWIKNIWLPDSSTNSIMAYNDFKGYVEKYDASLVPDETEYNTIMGVLKDSPEYSGWNGLYLLSIIAALSTFLSSYINTLVARIKAKRKGITYTPGPEANKSMLIIMPLIMGLFTFFSSASFGLYVVTSSIFATITGVFISLIVEKIDAKAVEKENSKTKNTYDRKY